MGSDLRSGYNLPLAFMIHERVNNGFKAGNNANPHRIENLKMIPEKPLEWHFEGSCIRCTSHTGDRQGYPRISRKGLRRTIARHILIRRLGSSINPKIVSRHTCDNTWCINPHHIISGTQADNIKDAVGRGRAHLFRGTSGRFTTKGIQNDPR